MRISDWSSDVCSSDLRAHIFGLPVIAAGRQHHAQPCPDALCACTVSRNDSQDLSVLNDQFDDFGRGTHLHAPFLGRQDLGSGERSEEHTSELQSLMRISYAVFCLKKKHNNHEISAD